MFLTDDGVVRSASDLKAALECEWALMRRLDARLGRVIAVPEPEDALNRRAAALGDLHESHALEAYERRFGAHEPGRPGGVAVVARPEDARDPVALDAAQATTLAAIADGADVVFQATFFDGAFVGFADFLLRSPDGGDGGGSPDGSPDGGGSPDGEGDGSGGWTVADTKLARRARVSALMQVAAYADALSSLGVPLAPEARLLLGDGTESVHPLAEILPVHRIRRARLDALVAERLAASGPVAWGDPEVRACGRCAECTAQVEATRDVLLVGRLSGPQRARLLAADVSTIDALAERTEPVRGIGTRALRTLQVQAGLQLGAPQDSPNGRRHVDHRVVDAAGLAALPAPDAGDVFFDFEGDPLWTDDERTWGLEYCFGVVDHDDGREHYRPFWAHDRESEKQALLDFLAYLRERRARRPGMHVYHYADYERSHLQQLCARHGVGESTLDALLAAHVFVDLYPVVTRSIRISDRSYSLKKLEPLYMGDRLRESDVTNGADSIDAYVRYGDLLRAGNADAAADQLERIGGYNRYDCVSTLGLRDWLIARADELEVPRRIDPEPPGPRDDALARREDAARDALLAPVQGRPDAQRTADERALALAAAAIEYHRREDKSYWWEHYNRHISPLEDWADTRDVFLVEGVQVHEPWARRGRRWSDNRVLRLLGRLAPGSTLGEGDERYVMYDAPLPIGCDPAPSGQRGEHRGGVVVAVRPAPGDLLEVLLDESAGLSEAGPNEGWSALPVALTPPAPHDTRAQRSAILGWGEGIVAALPESLPDAALDLLRRTPPRLAVPHALPEPGADPVAGLVRAALALDSSYLAVQGPPGSGKTHVGAAVIATLLQQHRWRIGVVAQSHAVVENLLTRVLDLGVDPGSVAKRPPSRGGADGPWTSIRSSSGVLPWLVEHGRQGYVFGGTAWDFANAGKVPRRELDLLVIDEAGQYSLANTIAVGVSARNLLLLGDPQQLPQVSQGLHPEPVDSSALGWLSAGRAVLPASHGVFLAESWRMHPALTRSVSALSYDGRLRARRPETTDRSLEGVAPGLHAVPVPSTGRTSESPEEADRVVAIVRDHVGRRWHDPAAGRPDDRLTPADVIVVAPYNAQVALLRARLDEAGFASTEVGTVDRFQGREAAVAVVSLTASSALDVPRGIGFVLLRNRLNVAISRAKWAAYLLHSPALADTLPRTAEQVAELGAFLRLVRAG